MVVYILETAGGEDVKRFFKNTESKLKGGDLLSNPFSHAVIKPLYKDEVWMISFKPVYPPVYLFGFLWSGISLLAGFGWWWLIPAGLLFSQAFFFLSPFYVFMNKLGLRKAGYKGVVKRLSCSEVVKRFL